MASGPSPHWVQGDRRRWVSLFPGQEQNHRLTLGHAPTLPLGETGISEGQQISFQHKYVPNMVWSILILKK